MMQSTDSREIVVIGAGVVGVTAAAHLAEAGHTVTVIDRRGVALETSYGNAGGLAFTEILPIASPGIMAKAPKWLLDPLGPLAIRPSYLPKIAPWLYRFWRASQPRQFAASLTAQTALNGLATQHAVAFYERIGIGDTVRHDGCLELYESEAQYRDSLHHWKIYDEAGIDNVHLGKADLADYQPGLSDEFVRAVFVPGWKTVGEPHRLAVSVWEHAERSGAVFCNAEARAIERGAAGRMTVRLADGEKLDADRIVIASGAWSQRLVSTVSALKIPLETERGYNTTLPTGAADIRRQLVFPGHGFVVTPLDTGIRVGGAVELAGLDLPPNFARSKAMLTKAKRFLPGLKTNGGTEWMGFRPSLPDTRPVIGALPDAPDVICAFGHGHLGLTQSVATAMLVRDIVAGGKTAIDIGAYRPDRFS